MIFSKENFEKSVNRLLSKPNNCGIDGILVSEFADYWKLNEEKILSILREGKYKPSAVLLEEMVFKKGKKRLISKYTCTDRVIQDVLKNKVMTMYKEKASKYSFAYIPDRGVHEAVQYAAALIESGKKFVAEIDVKDFFGNINLQRLEHILREEIWEEAESKLIHDYLYSWIVIDGRKERVSLGLVQGSPLSPVFSNVYMMNL